MDRADFDVTPGESRSTPIHMGGYFYNHDDEQDRADFADFSAAELVELELEHGYDFSAHPAMADTFAVTVNVVTGEIEVLATGEDVDIFHHNGRALGCSARLEPWGVEELGMERADAALAEMGWQRVSPWEGEEIVTCKVTPAES